ncbi:LemA family protein [Nitrosomonas sp.]|uniref:LemA family protein n=1 Tax=Nitrosomonas sp. TaxID=42353 RepID=UPI001D9F7ABF|nr:LemA family protein [Nitrosomonas sp.]MCB1948839.1 LemA family protein [Nitrosomonas sp.]MCP5241837.1 LemA family protein [Burkholderiales bacterium]MDR4513168.1 LemA family protein [Nitrosomonas sp.]
MEISTIVILIALSLLVIYLILMYNNLVQLKHNVSKAWSNIDVLLKQRHDELPKLVETCKQYMGYEKNALETIIKARSAVAHAQKDSDIKALGVAETQLRLGLGNLFALAEAYPELKANESFQHLQSRITALEHDIADRREFYNESTNLNNIRIEQFPDVLVAKIFGFKAFDLLEFSETDKADVNVSLLFQ